MCSTDGTMNLRCLWRQILRPLLDFSASSPTPSLLKMFQRALEDLVLQPVMEAVVVGTESPGLPHDVLMDIFALLDIPDLVRAGSVCTSWHAAYTSICSNSLLQQTPPAPCLLYTSESAGVRAMGLYSLAEKKAYTLTLPDPPIQSRQVIGSSCGWIITADEASELHAVNPITGDQIALPSVTTIEQVKPIFYDAGAICSYEYSPHCARLCYSSLEIMPLAELREYLYYKAFLSSDPSTGDYFVVLIHNPNYQLSFARAGDDKWTWLPPETCYEDCLFQGGLLYACTSFGAIHVFELGAASAIPMKIVLDKVKPYAYERVYIVQHQCGELMQIWRSEDEDSSLLGDDYEYNPVLEHEPSPPRMTNKIKVHKVDLTSQKLVDANTLDSNVLFIGLNQSLCLCAKEYPQLKANHAYFTDDDEIGIKFSKNDRRDIGEFDLAKNSNKEIVSPQLWSNSPTPVWLVPNPRRMSVPLHN